MINCPVCHAAFDPHDTPAAEVPCPHCGATVVVLHTQAAAAAPALARPHHPDVPGGVQLHWLAIALVLICFVTTALTVMVQRPHLAVYRAAYQELRADSAVAAAVGGTPTFGLLTYGDVTSRVAKIGITIKGPRRSTRARVMLKTSDGQWQVESVALRSAGGNYHVVLDRPAARRQAEVEVKQAADLLDQNQAAEALALLDHAVALDSLSDNIAFYRGRALKALGRNEEASQEFERQIAHAPDDGAAFGNLGVLRDAAHDHRGAMTLYQKACDLGDQPTCNYLKTGQW